MATFNNEPADLAEVTATGERLKSYRRTNEDAPRKPEPIADSTGAKIIAGAAALVGLDELLD